MDSESDSDSDQEVATIIAATPAPVKAAKLKVKRDTRQFITIALSVCLSVHHLEQDITGQDIHTESSQMGGL